ncbi:MAG TPA: DUF2784 domain-containing protein [Flavisolibacter sp.]|nr:DUF2784 domain-containing protein [Flavisolibacter sp.]
MNTWYSLLNIFFFIFHTAFTLFNIFGWTIPPFRKWNLITLLLTAFSWFFLGIWYGWGYCLCTDWHFKVRSLLGFHDPESSYIRFLILKLTGKDFNETLVETVTLLVFIISLVMSLWLNIRDRKRHQKQTTILHED